MLAITTPKRAVDAQDDAVIGIEAEAKAIVRLEMPQIQIRPFHLDLPGVIEERAVEAGPDLEAVLALQQQRMRTAEPVVAEPAQRVASAECRHQIKRHLLVVVSAG